MRYKAFISYSHVDAKWAKWIQRALERYRVPDKLVDKHGLKGNRLHPIFLDRDELSSSSSLSSVIQSALEASDNLIIVCSPAAAASHWVNEEIRTFKALGRGERIFCLIVDGDDGTYFPPALLDDEPLGVDVRSHADGRQNAKLKLIASLVEIPFASLKDREQRRRARLFAVATTAALVVAGVMTALAINAVLAGREAERNRVLATEALEDAEAVAGFLATMLTEVDPEAMGRTIVDGVQSGDDPHPLPPGFNSTDLARQLLDEHVLAKATVAVKSQFEDQPEIGARLGLSLGASYYAIGLYDNAIERYTQARDLYQAQYGDEDARTVSAQVGLGMSYLYEGRLDESVETFETTLNTARQSLGRHHEETLSAMNGLAMAYTDFDRLEEGRDLLEELSELMIETKGRDHLDTIDVRANLAWNLYLLGDYERSEEIHDELYGQRVEALGPEAYATLSILNNLALIYARTGRLEQAEAAHREEWEISQRTMGADHPEVLVSMLNLGRVTMKLGRFDDASGLLLDALSRAERVLPPVHPLLAAIMTACGEVQLELGYPEEALKHFMTTRGIYEQMFEPGHPRFDRLDDLIAQATAG